MTSVTVLEKKNPSTIPGYRYLHLLLLLLLKCITWMEHFPYRLCEVAVFFEMLRERGEVASSRAPVGVEVVQTGGVWAATSQKRGPAGAAKRLLQPK